jgi:hypothetical protein
MAVGSDGYSERTGRTGELDASRHAPDPGSGDELDAIQIVTWAERGGRVARPPGSALRLTDPRRESEEENSSQHG